MVLKIILIYYMSFYPTHAFIDGHHILCYASRQKLNKRIWYDKSRGYPAPAPLLLKKRRYTKTQKDEGTETEDEETREYAPAREKQQTLSLAGATARHISVKLSSWPYVDQSRATSS